MEIEELGRLAADFEGRGAEEVLRWAVGEFFPEIALACSFGAEDVVLVDLLSRINKEVKIFCLNTDLLFPETLEVRDKIAQRYGIKVIEVKPSLSLEEQAERYGEKLWERNPDLCCQLRKVQPCRNFLSGLKAWITGIRREQSPTRANSRVIEWDGKFGLVKINPLAGWSYQQVWDYIFKHNVPYNRLYDRGYTSIGCWPCTRPIKPGEDLRAGRWPGFQKTECGLHG